MNIEAFKILGQLKQFTTGEYICTEKEEGDTAYLLLQGLVDIVRDAHLKSPEYIARLRPGVIFGEMSLLENKPRNASAIAATDDVVALELTKDNFLSVLDYTSYITEPHRNRYSELPVRFPCLCHKLQEQQLLSSITKNEP